MTSNPSAEPLDLNLASSHHREQRPSGRNNRRKRVSSGHFGLIADEVIEDLKVRQSELGDDAIEEEFEEPETLWWTNLLVSHPFLVHACVAVFCVFATWLAAQQTEVTRIALESLVPDFNKYGDDWRAMQSMAQQKVKYLTKPQTYADPYVFQQMFFCLTPEAIAEDNADEDLEAPWIFTPTRVKTIIDYEDLILKNEAWSKLIYYPAGVQGSADYHGDLLHGDAVLSLPQMLRASLEGKTDEEIALMPKGTFKGFIGLALKISESAVSLFDPTITTPATVNGNDTTLTARCYRSIFWGSLPYPTNETTAQLNGTNSSFVTVKESLYEDAWDRQREQQKKACVDPFRSIYEDIDVKHNGEYVDNGMRIRTYSGAIWLQFNEEWMLNTIVRAFYFCVCCIIVYTTYDIGSFFLSMMALWEIIVTIPLSWFLYRVVFQIPQLGGLNFSTVFILFSVGVYYYPAYVFVDHWMQSKHLVKDPMDYKRRMSAAWKESATAAGVAQSTTFVTFLSAGIGSVMWFRSFGMWAGTAIAVNYLLGITLYPCSIIIWEMYLRKYEKAFTTGLKKAGLGIVSFQVADAYHARYLKRKTGSFSDSLMKDPTVKFIDVGYGPQSYEQLKQDYRPAGRFMGVRWPSLVWKWKIPIMVIFISWFAFAIYNTSQLPRVTEAEAFHGEDSFFYKSQHQSASFTKGQTDLNQVALVYGMYGLEPGSRNEWDSFDYGVPKYRDFDLSSVSAQEYLEYVCSSTFDANHLPEGEQLVGAEEHVICWIDEFKLYLSQVHNLSYPVHGVEQNEFNRYLYDFYYYSEQGLDAIEGSVMQISTNGEHPPIEDWDSVDSDIVYSLKMMRLSMRTKYLFWSTQADCDRDLANWIIHEAHLNQYCEDNVVDGATNGLCSMIQVSIRWAVSDSYDAFIAGAKSALLMGMAIVFIILMIVLQNWIIAGLCVVDMAFILASCMCVANLMEWEFGIIESCVVIMVCGFSVDYSVHLGHGYLTSPVATDRKGRTRYTLLTTGHAILSSAFISFVATVPLLVGGYMMYMKMGIMIMCTIGFSVSGSFTVFTLFLLSVAPESNDTGRVPLQRWIWRYLCCSGCKGERARNGEKGEGMIPV